MKSIFFYSTLCLNGFSFDAHLRLQINVLKHHNYNKVNPTSSFQTCDDLGFTYSDKEWLQIRKMLQNSCQNNSSSSSDTKVEQGDIVVRSEDFFSAIHTINGNKQNRQRMSGSGAEVKVSNFGPKYFPVELNDFK